MTHERKINAAKKAYQLDDDGKLWTIPSGSRPITQEAILVIVDGLAYRIETQAVIDALTEPEECQNCHGQGNGCGDDYSCPCMEGSSHE